ncbi:MAG: hypothetical protein KF817_06725 [Phycisphaeraceae bacterium]|nr:hypothetical protein [Phycisphaeraceae bacterium]
MRRPDAPVQPGNAAIERFDMVESRRTGVVDEATAAARQLVAIALIQPALAQVHDSGFATGPFQPGAAERRLRPMLDSILAERIAATPAFPLVDRVRDALLSRGQRLEVTA